MIRFVSFVLALASLIAFVVGEDVLFPFMRGLPFHEYDEALKLGLTAHVCKDDNEWYSMTTADFAKYKAIIIPDCRCNTSLDTIKFLDDTKKVWSPAVTGNVVLIGTDPSYHIFWYKLPGAYAMMRDAISLASTGKNGTGMYFSLSCYYQSKPVPTPVSALSEIGDFKVRGNLTCLNRAHIVATVESLTSLDDEMASNWNCSVHEVFTQYPTQGPGAFEPLAIALNTSGMNNRTFADGTVGIPYIIARGATPLGCGNNITETDYNEECDWGKLNGKPDSLCSSSCKCLYGMISPGLCRPNTITNTTSTSSTFNTTTAFTNSSTIPLSTSWPTNSSFASSVLYTNTSTALAQTRSRSPTVTITVSPWINTTTSTHSPPPLPSGSLSDDYYPVTITITAPSPPPHTMPMPPGDTNSDLATIIVTASGEPETSPSASASATSEASETTPGTVFVTVSGNPGGESHSGASSQAASSALESLTDPETVIVTASGSSETTYSSKTPSRSNTVPETVTITVSDDSVASSYSYSSLISNTLPETVTVTASGDPNSVSFSSSSQSSDVPETVILTTSGNAGTASSSSPPSESANSPGTTIFFTASGNPVTVSSSSSEQASSRLGSWQPTDIITASADPNQSTSQLSSASTSVPPAGSASSSVPGGSNAGTESPDTPGQSGSVTPPTWTVTSGAPRPSSASGSPQTSLASTWSGTKTPSGWPTSQISKSSQDVASFSGGQPGLPPTTITRLPSVQFSSGTGGPGAGSSTESSASSLPTTSPKGQSGSTGATGSLLSSVVSSGGLPAVSQPGTSGVVTDSSKAISETNTADPFGGSSTAIGSWPGNSYSISGSVTILPSSNPPGNPWGNPSGNPAVNTSFLETTTTDRQFNGSFTSTVLSLPPGITPSTLISFLPTTIVAPRPSSSSECDTWIGIEIIHMIEVIEICPSGATVTETITSCTETFTRSICTTSATNYPCYPCIFGTSTNRVSVSDTHSTTNSGDLVTVTVTSCPTLPHATQTVTIQLCSTCTTSVYVGTVPGHVPGGDCYGCFSGSTTSGASSTVATAVVVTDRLPGSTRTELMHTTVLGGSTTSTILPSTLTQTGTCPGSGSSGSCDGDGASSESGKQPPVPISTGVGGVGGPDPYGPPGSGGGSGGASGGESGSGGGGYPGISGLHLTSSSVTTEPAAVSQVTGGGGGGGGGGGAQYTYTPAAASSTTSIPAVVTAGASAVVGKGGLLLGRVGWMEIVMLGVTVWLCGEW